MGTEVRNKSGIHVLGYLLIGRWDVNCCNIGARSVQPSVVSRKGSFYVGDSEPGWFPVVRGTRR